MDPAVPATLCALLAPFAPIFSRPSFQNFQALAVGWILCPGRHTLTRVIQAALGIGYPRKHHATFYRFVSRARWSVDALGEGLLKLALPYTGSEVVAVVDDTLCRRSGPHLFGAGMHHDALRSTYGRGVRDRFVAFAFGHNWVVLAIVVAPPWNPNRRFAIPIFFRLYRSKKKTPQDQYRKRTELGRDLVELARRALPDGYRLHVVGDAEYACQTVVRSLPGTVHFTGPISKDAALSGPPPSYSGRGRPALRGARLPSPKQLGRARSDWQKVTVSIYGKQVAIQTLTLLAYWYTVAKDRPVRVVLTRDPSGRLEDRAYFCTDTSRSVPEILQVFAHRWEIEVAFRTTKQTLGLQDAQNGWWRRPAGSPKPRMRPGPNPRGIRGRRAIEHTLPLAFFAYALVLLWYFQHGRPAVDVKQARAQSPWYTQKVEPSFADMLVALRREIWRLRLFTDPSLEQDPSISHPLLAGWALAA